MLTLRKGTRCFITSITQLPMFYRPGTILYGSMFSVTEEVYDPVHLEIIQGRNIEIPNSFYKYKIELMVEDELCDVICITNGPFDAKTIYDPARSMIKVYPIFIHSYRETYLFIEAINDLFADTKMVVTTVGTDKVMSPMAMLNTLDNLMYPGHLQPYFHDTRYSRVKRPDTLINILMTAMNSDKPVFDGMSESMENTYGIPDGIIPLEVQFFGNVRNVFQLRRFLSPYGSMPSDIAQLTTSYLQQNLDRITDNILAMDVLPDKVSDIYMSEAEDFSYTGRWLSVIYTQPANDFRFDIRTEHEDLSIPYMKAFDVHNGFKQSVDPIDDWVNLMDYLCLSFNLDTRFKGMRLEAQRSWLEDIVIKDANGRILLYVDMVMWMLACADGLLNAYTLYQLDPTLV